MNTAPGHECKYEGKIVSIDSKIDVLISKVDEIGASCQELKEAQCGSTNGFKRGNNVRFEILENWRASVNKVLWALFLASLAFVGFIVRSFIIKGI